MNPNKQQTSDFEFEELEEQDDIDFKSLLFLKTNFEQHEDDEDEENEENEENEEEDEEDEKQDSNYFKSLLFLETNFEIDVENKLKNAQKEFNKINKLIESLDEKSYMEKFNDLIKKEKEIQEQSFQDSLKQLSQQFIVIENFEQIKPDINSNILFCHIGILYNNQTTNFNINNYKYKNIYEDLIKQIRELKFCQVKKEKTKINNQIQMDRVKNALQEHITQFKNIYGYTLWFISNDSKSNMVINNGYLIQIKDDNYNLINQILKEIQNHGVCLLTFNYFKTFYPIFFSNKLNDIFYCHDIQCFDDSWINLDSIYNKSSQLEDIHGSNYSNSSPKIIIINNIINNILENRALFQQNNGTFKSHFIDIMKSILSFLRYFKYYQFEINDNSNILDNHFLIINSIYNYIEFNMNELENQLSLVNDLLNKVQIKVEDLKKVEKNKIITQTNFKSIKNITYKTLVKKVDKTESENLVVSKYQASMKLERAKDFIEIMIASSFENKINFYYWYNYKYDTSLNLLQSTPSIQYFPAILKIDDEDDLNLNRTLVKPNNFKYLSIDIVLCGISILAKLSNDNKLIKDLKSKQFLVLFNDIEKERQILKSNIYDYLLRDGDCKNQSDIETIEKVKKIIDDNYQDLSKYVRDKVFKKSFFGKDIVFEKEVVSLINTTNYYSVELFIRFNMGLIMKNLIRIIFHDLWTIYKDLNNSDLIIPTLFGLFNDQIIFKIPNEIEYDINNNNIINQEFGNLEFKSLKTNDFNIIKNNQYHYSISKSSILKPSSKLSKSSLKSSKPSPKLSKPSPKSAPK